MTTDLLIALASFAFVSSVTPGPNNLMLMASGANYGFRRSLPHMIGISIGFSLMIFLVGVGMMQVFDRYPVSLDLLRVGCVGYMLFLAWKVANASAPGTATATGRPLSFLQAALFQWVNPKAWAMALTAIALYAPDRSLGAVLLVAVIFGVVNAPSVTIWTVLGQQISRVLTRPGLLRGFNWTMAALLLASLVPFLL